VSKDMSTLQAVATLAEQLRKEGPRIRAKALAAAKVEVAALEEAVERSVVAALQDEHSVTEVARALSTPGKTPNRNKVYEIKKKYEGQIESRTAGYPFEWVAREVATREGVRTVYDIRALVNGFGPDDVTGEYTWRYETDEDGQPRVEPVFSLDYEPWPTSKFYRSLIGQWIGINPYPGDE